MGEYLARIVDAELANRLSSSGAVVIEGPKACGKTETARKFAASEVLLDIDGEARAAIAVEPGLILEGEIPRLIDEWQVEPSIWNHIRRAVDSRKGPGQFILTGSAVPADDILRHSGAGRLTRVNMRPMTLFELGDSTREISLMRLFDGESPRCKDPKWNTLDLATKIATGGWPGNLEKNTSQSVRAVRDYLDEIRRTDVGRVDNTRRDPERVGRLLQSLARNTATLTTTKTLASDTGGADGALKVKTVQEYLLALERLMIVEDQPAWSPNLRSRSRLRRAPKRHFVDPSLAVAALRMTPGRLSRDLSLLGFMFESLVTRDIRVYAQQLDASVFHYKDNTDLEVDIIVEATDGRWAAFEVKLGHGYIDEAAVNLKKMAARIDSESLTSLAVIVGTGLGYRRADGVSVIPIGAFGP